MSRLLLRAAALALGAIAAAAPAAAQKNEGGMGPFALTGTTDRPLRAVYRAAIDALRENGYPLQVMSLDQMLITDLNSPQAGKPSTVARVLVEEKGDSVTFTVEPVAVNAVRNGRCTTQECLTLELAAGAMIVKGIEDRMKAYQPPPRSMADSLADAKALGYAPENPVKVGGGGERGVQNEHAWLDGLRGPDGQAVTWFRLGSCCEFETPNAPRDMQGHGLLDAYEVTYPGLPHPVLLYLDMYDPPADQAVPPGFTRPAAQLPAT